MDLRVSWCLVLCSIVTITHGVFTTKGYYCRDPDTGKLYPINSTWSSSTFCGSYTCKLRRKNNTESHLPIKHIDIINKIPLTADQTDILDEIVEIKKNCSQMDSKVEAVRGIEQILHKNKADGSTYVKLENYKNVELGATNEADRYLTNEEVKALISILQTMKKSDLEAILEIYNLAQDIYKEIDKAEQTEGANSRKHQNLDDIIDKHLEIAERDNNYVSYWYEPLASPNVKAKEVKPPALPQPISNVPEPYIMSRTNYIEKPVSKPAAKTQLHTPVYFSNPLTYNDFRKLPYYYPVSSFQRESSYVHTDDEEKQPVQPIQTERKEKITEPVMNISPWYMIKNKPYGYDLMNEQKYEKPAEKTDPMTSQFNLLNYPVTYVQYNISDTMPNNVVVKTVVDDPWGFFYSRSKKNQATPFEGTTYLQHLPNTYILNPETGEEAQSEEHKPVQRTSSEEVAGYAYPEWQTEPLSDRVLNDVRSHTETKLLPFPFRKKIKLQRVGKLMALNDSSRRRRQAVYSQNVQVPDDFEVYIEKSTCATDTQPGFFRIGNESQPFPACCPQRIS